MGNGLDHASLCILVNEMSCVIGLCVVYVIGVYNMSDV